MNGACQRKDDIIYNMSKYFHNINLHSVPCKTQLPWQLEDWDKNVAFFNYISGDNKIKTSSKKKTIQQSSGVEQHDKINCCNKKKNTKTLS